MAGFEALLKKHAVKKPLGRLVLQEAADSFEAVGPWFITLLCLAVMGTAVHLITREAPILFYLMLTYATALSLIIASPFHAMLNRYLADQIFLGRFQPIINNLIGLVMLVLPLTAVPAAGLAFFLSDIDFHLKMGFIALTVLFSMLWCISSVLCSLRKERLLLYLYFAGMATALFFFAVLRKTETPFLLFAFSIGISVPTAGGTAYILKAYIREEVRASNAYLKRNRTLVLGLSMLLFNIGFWVDKVIFWFSDRTGNRFDPLFHYYSDYDYPFFIALTTMMMGSIIVYRGIKRKVTRPYEAFIFKLSNNFPFSELALEKYRLFQGISQVSSSILVFYGGTVSLILFLVYIRVINLPWRNPFVFHYLLIGTIFFSLYFFFFLVLQYLDDYKDLLILNLLFVVLNAAGTIISIQYGIRYYGAGFMAASMAVSLVSFAMVNSKVGGLEYKVFMDALEQTNREKEPEDDEAIQKNG